MKQHSNHRIIISGGGTGGHIFPAVSIAHAIRIQDPGAEILFVGLRDGWKWKKCRLQDT
jgi:UDP-N-acetylglucosamine--N-acetylmuramyl-(pentapeptide) pyrophosphoryl-undecaprenol N-acetylglucosamine transferase